MQAERARHYEACVRNALSGGKGTVMTDDPFAALTIVVAPALLTNASTVLCLGTATRFGRVLDRTREVSAQLARLESGANRTASRTTLRILLGNRDKTFGHAITTILNRMKLLVVPASGPADAALK